MKISAFSVVHFYHGVHREKTRSSQRTRKTSNYNDFMKSLSQSIVFKLSIVSSALFIIYFIFTSQFWAHWWFWFLFTGLFVFPFFLIITIRSIVWWIKNRTKYNLSYVPFCITLLAIFLAYCLPSSDRSKRYYKGTGTLFNYQTGKCLYIECFCVYGYGYMTTDLNSKYLTDSVSFRKYLGVYDEGDESINVICKGDSIIVEKTSSESINIEFSDPRVLEKKSYSLKELKREHVFE